MKHNYTISTKNILLLPLSLDDSQKLRILRNRDDNRKWFKSNNIISAESQIAWYERYLASSNEIMFAIHDAKTNEFLGVIGLYDINNQKHQAEIGRLLIDRTIASGRGLGSEALITICQLAFSQLNLRLIYAEIYANNYASIKSFEKAHFSVQRTTMDNKGIPMIVTQITKESFFNACSLSQT